MQMQTWLERYTPSLERDNATPYTVKNYRTDIGQFLAYCAEQSITTLDKLHRDLVRAYLAELDDVGYARASIARRVLRSRRLRRSSREPRRSFRSHRCGTRDRPNRNRSSLLSKASQYSLACMRVITRTVSEMFEGSSAPKRSERS